MRSTSLTMDKVPKKIRVELVIDTEENVLDAQIFDATDRVLPGQEIVTGTDALNEKLEQGYRLVDIIRPRIPPCSYLVERSIALERW